jgi:type IV secretory pathway VirB10-like protein
VTVSDKSIIDPEPNKPGIPIKKGTLGVIAALVVGLAFVSALLLDSGTPAPASVAPAQTKSTDPAAESGSKLVIDEELKKAKKAAEEEDLKNNKPKPVEPAVTGAASTSGSVSPLPPGVRRDNQDSAFYDKSVNKSGPTTRGSAVTGNGRGEVDFEGEALVRSAKSVAFDESTPVSSASQGAPNTMGLPNLDAPPSGNSPQRTGGFDERAGSTVQPPSAAIDRMLANLRTVQGTGPSTGRSQGGGTGNTAWVNEYASSSGARTAETIKSQATSSPFTLHQGKVIPAVLGRQINSDLPGGITAYVVTDVYDSLGNGALLIPKGSVLVGQYSSDIKPGQSRLLFAFSRIIMPDGQSFDLPAAQGTDLAGASGVEGDVNNHFFKMFAASFFTAWLTDRVSPTVSNGVNTSVSPAGQVLVDVSRTVLDRNKSIPPTITIDQGTRINVEVKKDMEFSGPFTWRKR